ncbi:hypothetical protein SEA_MUFASA8_44 [Arthrobacter phage Mufasa8]|uniref:Uncharacterized protein n=1 Tax=Arthrobacter phage Mufasa8 TaxID=2656526 RepID=A0A649VPA2_9CAUD|nr:hypothetical protein HYQ08_gp044 [Arthrobacter phage Mufasa8]QGJ93493.1 hypothetical protein SEA_MUFASA8_44 [Arthrobacter phage Mufasa8]
MARDGAAATREEVTIGALLAEEARLARELEEWNPLVEDMGTIRW